MHIMTRNNLGNANKGKYTKWLNGGGGHTDLTLWHIHTVK